jgi:transposase
MVVRHVQVKREFVLLPRRGVVERNFAWMVRFRRLGKDYERMPQVLAGLRFVVFTVLLLGRLAPKLALTASA